MKTILITGCNGQLGRELTASLETTPDVAYLATDYAELDITDIEAIETFLMANPNVDYIINCAAYTAVDRAESDRDACRRLNVDAPGYLAVAATRHGARLIHISTDYVYPGDGNTPYREDQAGRPTGIYGLTKLEGERHVIEECPDAIILRTAWLYSPHGHNFVKTMLDRGRRQLPTRVVNDQTGCPTSATDLARAIVTIVTSDKWLPGVYNYTDDGIVTWYQFTEAIYDLAGYDKATLSPCTTADYPTPARRPPYSALDKTRIRTAYPDVVIPDWRTSLSACIKRISEIS